MCDNIEVWFNPSAMANALSHGLLTKKCRIDKDSAYHLLIFMHKLGKGECEFKKLGCGLHVHNSAKPILNNKPSFINYNFI